jgi:hypothetical protein
MAAAMSISSSTVKDEALRDIARKALCNEDSKTFDAALLAIYSTSIKDATFDEAVDVALSSGQFNQAKAHATAIYFQGTRDRAMQRIVVASTAKMPPTATTESSPPAK